MATRKAPAAKAQPVSPAATTALTPPAIGQHWPEQGGTYIGIASDLPGGAVGHLVLLDERPAKELTWKQAAKWAKDLGNGARIPTRTESLLIYSNANQKVSKTWHWTCEALAASYAWGCTFYDGGQNGTHKYGERAAVAVRRLPLQSFNSLEGGAS